MLGVDTNVFINIIKPDDPAKQKAGSASFFKFVKNKKIPIAISAITVAEIFSRPFKHKSKDEIQTVDEFLHYVDASIVSINRNAAVEAARLIGEFNMDFADALIAASLIFAGVKTFVTRNVADYKETDLEVLTPEDFMKKRI